MKQQPKYFYSHLIDLSELEHEIETLDISPSEKSELMDLADVNLHQTVLDAILSQLTDTDKKRFMELLLHGEDEKIWSHLNEKVEKVEDKITKAANDIKQELKEDIKKVKESKKN